MAKSIKLYDGSTVTVDDSDYEELKQYRWYAAKSSKYKYAIRRTFGRSKTESMHRVIMDAKPGTIVDHIDGNTLNNQRANLRLVGKSENGQNRHRHNSATGFIGVQELNGRFQAQIGFHNKVVYLGRFKTAAEAARAYDLKAKELFGVFARLNFPEGPMTCWGKA